MLIASSVGAIPVVRYPVSEIEGDERYNYPFALLQLCKQKTQAFELEPTAFPGTQGRYLRMLEKNEGVDVAIGLTDKDRESRYLPVRVPIDRGLFGWRLLLIRSDKTPIFASIHSAEELAKLNAGLGHDWPDVDIFRANHLPVSTGSSYPGLFHMLTRDHVDYFPRAVTEVWPEQLANAHLNIEVEQHLVVYYPTAAYFFVNKNNHFLADTLTRCLTEAVNDGSFQSLFDQYFDEAINKSNLKNRTIVRLQNHELPAATPLHKKEFWYSPGEED